MHISCAVHARAGSSLQSTPMRRRSLLAGGIALACARTWAFAGLPAKFDPARDAAADVEQALALAQAQRKLVLLDVGGEWCSWCHIFDRFVAARPAVRKALEDSYVVVKVNWSPQNRNEKLLSRFPKAGGYPHFYVLDASGKLLASQASGELEAGKDYDEARVLAFLRRQQPAR
jgi:thiol:disulfide interchange protein